MNPDNPPAFPQPIAGCNDGSIYEVREKTQDGGGMSLRDWFAGMALPEFINGAHIYSGDTEGFVKNIKQVPRLAYELADAMLAERAKGKDGG